MRGGSPTAGASSNSQSLPDDEEFETHMVRRCPRRKRECDVDDGRLVRVRIRGLVDVRTPFRAVEFDGDIAGVILDHRTARLILHQPERALLDDDLRRTGMPVPWTDRAGDQCHLDLT